MAKKHTGVKLIGDLKSIFNFSGPLVAPTFEVCDKDDIGYVDEVVTSLGGPANAYYGLDDNRELLTEVLAEESVKLFKDSLSTFDKAIHTIFAEYKKNH